MTVPEAQIRDLTSVLTIVDGKVVHGDGAFSKLAPPLPPASPSWSPVNTYGGYYQRGRKPAATNKGAAAAAAAHQCAVHGQNLQQVWFADIPVADQNAFWGALGAVAGWGELLVQVALVTFEVVKCGRYETALLL